MHDWAPRARRRAIWLVLLAACEGGSSADAPGTNDDYERSQRLGEAICGLSRRCCGEAGFSTKGLVGCEAQVVGRNDGAVLAGAVSVDPARANACLALFATAPCNMADVVALNACAAAFVGNVREGGACRSAEDCAVDGLGAVLCLIPSDASGTGTCRKVPVAALDQPCSDTLEDGARLTRTTGTPRAPLARCRKKDGLVCDRQAGVCATLVPAEGACTQSDQCVGGLSCRVTCQAPLPVGAECVSDQDCSSRFCLSGTCTTALVDARLCEGKP